MIAPIPKATKAPEERDLFKPPSVSCESSINFANGLIFQIDIKIHVLKLDEM